MRVCEEKQFLRNNTTLAGSKTLAGSLKMGLMSGLTRLIDAIGVDNVTTKITSRTTRTSVLFFFSRESVEIITETTKCRITLGDTIAI